jgi:hypothetical protein
MAQYDSLIKAANKAIKSAQALLDNDNTPFNAMYKQYRTIQSFWFRVVEDAAESQSKRLEELCIDLEYTLSRCEKWIKENSPTKPTATEETESTDD